MRVLSERCVPGVVDPLSEGLSLGEEPLSEGVVPPPEALHFDIGRSSDDEADGEVGATTLHTIPLLVRMPDEPEPREVCVPINANVADVRAKLQEDLGKDASSYNMQFADGCLDPGMSLAEANIVETYESAKKMLQVIGAGNLDVDMTTQALNSACAVVTKLSNGCRDMEQLCSAACDNAEHPPADVATHSAPDNAAAATASSAPSGTASSPNGRAEETPHDGRTGGDASTYPGAQELLDSLAHIANGHAAGNAAQAQSNHPAQLVRNLSRRLPSFFSPEATEGVADMRQPSIADIRAVRRMRGRGAAQDSASATPSEEETPDLSAGAACYAAAAASGFGGTGTSFLADPDPRRKTWFHHLRKSWRVGAVRKSGALEESELGREVGRYLDSFDVECNPHQHQKSHSAPAHLSSPLCHDAAGESEGSDDDGGTLPAEIGLAVPEARPIAAAPGPFNGNTNGHDVLQDAMREAAYQRFMSPAPPASGDVSKSPSTCLDLPNEHVASSRTSTPGASSSAGAVSAGSASASGSKPQCKRTRAVPRRHAARIAPRTPATTPAPTCSSEVFNASLAHSHNDFSAFMVNQSVPLPGGHFAARRLGVKRKNDPATDADVRASSLIRSKSCGKPTRLRRRAMEASYERKIEALINEQTALKAEVARLQQSLVEMQALLTITIHPANGTAQSLCPLFPLQNGIGPS